MKTCSNIEKNSSKNAAFRHMRNENLSQVPNLASCRAFEAKVQGKKQAARAVMLSKRRKIKR